MENKEIPHKIFHKGECFYYWGESPQFNRFVYVNNLNVALAHKNNKKSMITKQIRTIIVKKIVCFSKREVKVVSRENILNSINEYRMKHKHFRKK